MSINGTACSWEAARFVFRAELIAFLCPFGSSFAVTREKHHVEKPVFVTRILCNTRSVKYCTSSTQSNNVFVLFSVFTDPTSCIADFSKALYVTIKNFILVTFFCSDRPILVVRTTERRVSCWAVNEVFWAVRPLAPAMTHWGLFHPLRSDIRLPYLPLFTSVSRSGFWLSGAEINCKLKNSLISSPSHPPCTLRLSV